MTAVREINWAYLAGFTDADGHISISHQKGCRPEQMDIRVEWSQRHSESWVLDEIEMFLASKGMKTHSRNYNNHTSRNLQTKLTLYRVEDCRKVLMAMSPYLIVKREPALRALEHLKIKRGYIRVAAP